VAYIELLIEENTSENGNMQLDARGGCFDALAVARLLRCDAVYYDANGFERAASEDGPHEGCGEFDDE
jgi:hypothetical protein